MSRRSIVARSFLSMSLAVGLGGVGCGGDSAQQLEIPKGSINPGGDPPAAKPGKGQAVKSIKNRNAPPSDSK